MKAKLLQPATTYPAIVGAVVRAFRERMGMTQAELAERMNLAGSTWSRIEGGTSGLSIEQLVRFGVVFHLQTSTVLMLADHAYLMASHRHGLAVCPHALSQREATKRGLALVSSKTLAIIVQPEINPKKRSLR